MLAVAGRLARVEKLRDPRPLQEVGDLNKIHDSNLKL